MSRAHLLELSVQPATKITTLFFLVHGDKKVAHHCPIGCRKLKDCLKDGLRQGWKELSYFNMSDESDQIRLTCH